VHARTHTYTNVHVHSHTHKHMHTHTHMHALSLSLTHTHTHTHTHTDKNESSASYSTWLGDSVGPWIILELTVKRKMFSPARNRITFLQPIASDFTRYPGVWRKEYLILIRCISILQYNYNDCHSIQIRATTGCSCWSVRYFVSWCLWYVDEICRNTKSPAGHL